MAVQTNNATIDFDELPSGEPLQAGRYVRSEWLDAYGLKLSASGGFIDFPRIFDTSDNDPGLGSPNESCSPPGPGKGEGGAFEQPGENCIPQGNALIVQGKLMIQQCRMTLKMAV